MNIIEKMAINIVKRTKKVDVKNLYIGNLGIIYDCEETKEDNDIYDITLKLQSHKEGRLLLRNIGHYLDLQTNIRYPDSNISIGSVHVYDERPAKDLLYSEEIVPEKISRTKILRKYKEYMNNNEMK